MYPKHQFSIFQHIKYMAICVSCAHLTILHKTIRLRQLEKYGSS